MSRSGYSEDCDEWALIRWRGAVKSAIRGKRGQAFLKEMAAAMDSMPEKKLAEKELECAEGVCAIGSVGAARGIDMSDLDPDDRETVANVFGISPALVAEIVYENDEIFYQESPEHRFVRMRAWIDENLNDAAAKQHKLI